MKAWRVLLTVAALMTVVTVALWLMAIWNGDPRWGATAGVAAGVAFLAGFVGFLAAIEDDS